VAAERVTPWLDERLLSNRSRRDALKTGYALQSLDILLKRLCRTAA
jgi:hypothetical protein